MKALALVGLGLLLPAAAAGENGSIRGRIHNAMLARLPAAVYVQKVPGKTFPPPAEHPFVDQKDLTFVPHVLPVLVGTTVDFRNSDDLKHNVFSSRKSPAVFDLGTYGTGVVRSVKFDKPGVVSLLCNVHSEMSAFVVVVETPYFGVTDRTGAFVIEGVPPGSYQLAFWHERVAAPPQPVVVEASKTATVTWTSATYSREASDRSHREVAATDSTRRPRVER